MGPCLVQGAIFLCVLFAKRKCRPPRHNQMVRNQQWRFLRRMLANSSDFEVVVLKWKPLLTGTSMLPFCDNIDGLGVVMVWNLPCVSSIGSKNRAFVLCLRRLHN